MFRIGIFGSENSHAMAFARLFNGEAPEFADLRVVAIGGESAENSSKICSECGVDFIAKRPEDMIGHIDAAMVTSRDGRLHLRYARPFIEAGLPTFVDKPVTSDPREAMELIELARAKRVALTGGSSVKLLAPVQELAKLRLESINQVNGGYVWAPLSMINEYGGFFFYSAHLTEVCLEIFGMNPVSVDAFEKSNCVMAVIHYPEFDVSCHFLDGAYYYGAVLQTQTGAHIRELSLDDCYRLEALEYVEMLKTGRMSRSYGQLIQSVYAMDAIKRAYETGTRQMIGGIQG